jgi:cob(I)alamin adenosyltransferase
VQFEFMDRPLKVLDMTRILIFTGEGKGKTTAALGAVLRAAGHGWKSLVVQFIKADDKTGELNSCRFLPGVEIVQMGRGFPPKENHPAFAEHRQAAQEALSYAGQALASGSYDLVVLDEICGAISRKLVEEDSVLEILARETKASCIILTGRGAGPRLIERADTVTEMCCRRHALDQGTAAQQGVEY